MSDFKDMINRDRDVLFNIDELGEEHTINGRTVECVIDDQTNRERKGGAEFAVAQSTVFCLRAVKIYRHAGSRGRNYGLTEFLIQLKRGMKIWEYHQ